MRPQYAHDVVSSTVMWLDNLLCNTGQAYANITGSAQNPQGLLYLQPVTGGRNNIYASPYKGWVFDSCAAGAIVPSGFYNASGQFLTRASGLVIDFVNGQVSTPQNWGPTLSGLYSRKEMNVYYSSDAETQYVLQQVYGQDKSVSYILTGFQGRALAAPLMMVTNAKGKNEPWALGGTDNSENTIRLFVISDSNFLQDGVNSLLQDAAHTYIPFAPYSATPITASGDLKAPPWSYCSGIFDIYGCGNGMWIEDIIDYKLSDRANRNSTFFLSTIEIDLSKPRLSKGS